MKKLGLSLILLAAFSIAAQPGRPDPTAQREAMKKLEYMAGVWKGEGWIEMGGPRMTFRGTETVQRKLDGVALLVEGAFSGKTPGSDVEVPVHTTLAVISYDPAAKKYNFNTWLATGTAGDHELVLNSDGWQWDIATPGGTIRFVMKLNDKGEWVETGSRSADGTTWKQFFEMKLKK